MSQQPEQAAPLTLQILPDGNERVFDGTRRVVIGRDPNQADVIVAEPRASRIHATLTVQGGAWILEDASSQGTFVQNTRLTQPMVLPGPVVVRLGHPVDGQEVRLIPGARRPNLPPPGQQQGGARPGPPGPGPAQAPSPQGGFHPGQQPYPGPQGQQPPHMPGQHAPQAPQGYPGQQHAPQGPGGPVGAPMGAPFAGAHAGGATIINPQLQQQPWAQQPGAAPQAAPYIPQQSPAQQPQQPRLGEYTGVYQTSNTLRIGRDATNDIVLHDLQASRFHAELQFKGGRFEIVDKGSHNGTYLNGMRVNRAEVREGAIIAIARHLLRFHNGVLQEFVDTGGITFSAANLGVLAGPKVLLDNVSFALEGGDFLAVLGPTGAGKSTLMKALTGNRPADRGAVFYNGRDLYANYAELRNRVGYVPQDDILHPQLKVRDALRYAAQLRFPPDVPAAERNARVDEVMAELGLTERGDLAVEKLSGGQRKRTSVAIELLTRPSLLILDEPTSGLDPGYEKSVMDLLRKLADGGRTVITVTHSIQSLDRCDRILFLAPGGQTAFFGPPPETLQFFSRNTYAEVFQDLDRAAPGFAQHAFAGSPADQQYVQAPLGAQLNKVNGAANAQQAATPAANPHWGHQLSTLFKRFSSVVWADKRNSMMLFLQAPILGLLMLAVLGSNDLSSKDPVAAHKAGSVLLALVLGATYLGASNSIREIVKERPILTRERAIGLSPSAYVLSKVILLGMLTVAQAAVLVFLGIVRQGGPDDGSVMSSGQFELFFDVALAGLAAMALGLLISAFVSNGDKALTILPVILFAEFLFTGSAFPVNKTPGLEQASYLASAKWGYSAAASTANADILLGTGCNDTLPTGPLPGAKCDSTQAHKSGTWYGDMAALSVLTVVCIAGAWLAIRPVGQPKQK
ncbi:FHA modulated ABC efflux pump with fused ATPase and integral membrane subunits [Catenulispora acidiphila DSM 44928]|uniref:FHA modulated ABC efflux pump with fused ATPase and integral membrane subunits n=1 Tax=Catenulispora acidiphila (strain DSM 44928 / JCM 14897 / NBRC 102108 / NRRL B-24433 / ID139908) TaxID=479433 RepID=C7QHV5_CATAD|nr:ATP-binding cassette domain-containing protein [Catenulispora acidiphila]ACU71130.1 FHA modulated ABC efflux pump with fused ATPase and integral membrane subunits [Catenulispora acidiphila DSM 44928]